MRANDAPRDEQRGLMAYSAAVMFGGATVVGLLQSVIPGGQSTSIVPVVGAFAFVALLLLFGPRLPLAAMAALGPFGVAMIGFALATTDGATDGAVLFLWPVLWQTIFFGRRGMVAIVACVGVAQALALTAMPPEEANIDRWLDVMASVIVVGAVVEMLAGRNRELLDRISAEARVDELTGLLNRRGFEERAEVELARARREGVPLGAVSFDLDHFKRVNDEFGHEIGDRVLVRLADAFRARMRTTDVVARLGGEEFVALLPGADLEEARDFGERVRAELRGGEEPGTPPVTVSAGATAASAPDGIEGLLKRADMALYAAKSQGRNRTVTDRAVGSEGGGSEATSAAHRAT